MVALSVCLLAVVAAVGLFGPSPASANPKYAAQVMDEVTGEVLYARNADLQRFPASLTKVMTLYLLFEEINAGRLKLDTAMKASKRAAGQPPSKLGIRAGQRIKVKDAIRSLVIRSANDVAVVVAEHIAGTERNFARRMTNRAKQLGMTNTRFRNASGLPNRSQTTTARDMATLGQSIRRDFPQYAPYFSETKFSWGGRTWTTHNNVLEDYDGADGMKTGYTRASGFNLITSVERRGTRLIAVVMGGRTAKRRDKEMVRILNLNYKRIAANPKYRERYLAALPRPMPRPGSGVQVTMARNDGSKPRPMFPIPRPVDQGSDEGADAPRPIALAQAEADTNGQQLLFDVPGGPPRPVSAPDREEEEASGETAEPPVLPVQAPIFERRAKAALETGGEEAAPKDAIAEAIALASATPLPALRPDDNEPADGASEEKPRGLSPLTRGPISLTSLLGTSRTGARRSAASGDEGPSETGEGERDETSGEVAQGDGNSENSFQRYADAQSVLSAADVGIQVGAFLQFSTATRYIDNAMALVPSLLKPEKAGILKIASGRGEVFRARFGPFTGEDAEAACGLLEAKGMECFTIERQPWDEIMRPPW